MMRQSRIINLFCTLFMLLPVVTSHATPVYLRIDSRFASGHHTRQILESRTKKVQFQRWLRVETLDRSFGWIPEDQCLTALRLAREAVVIEPVPVRTEMNVDAIEQDIVSKGSRVTVLETYGSWARVSGHWPNSDYQESWVPTESLKPIFPPAPSSLSGQRVFLTRDASIYVLPGRPTSSKLAAGSMVHVLNEKPGWIEFRSSNRQGFLNRGDVVALRDLGERGARPLYDLVQLRSAPLPYADLLRTLPVSAQLKITGVETLRWGQAKVPEIGEVWWPMADMNLDDDKDLTLRERLTTNDLFHRKIFDMAASPAIPALKFVSAQGVYRTIDGNTWTKIPTFQDKNYPIAIAGLGSVFIGPFVSDDQGETFSQWIRWDTLVATLKKNANVSMQRLQIQEIRPEDPSGHRVVLKLSAGSGRSVRVVTDDQGLSWRAL